MTITINPGTGPVPDSTPEDAAAASDPWDDHLPAAISAAQEPPDAFLRRWDADQQTSRRTARAHQGVSVSPSDAGSCHRWVAYRERGDYTPTPTQGNAAALGTLIHEGVTRIREAQYPWRQFTVPVHVPGINGVGEVDEWDPVLGRVTDYKTAGHAKWERVAAEPPEYEWEQVLLYGSAFAAQGHDVVDVELLYVHRGTGDVESHIRSYDQAAADQVAARLLGLRDSIRAGEDIPRVRSSDVMLGPTRDALCRDYCPAVVDCWGLDAPPDGRTPESRVLIRDDKDIAGVAARYAAAKAREVAATTEREWLGDLIRGVPDGGYGDYEVKTSGGRVGKERRDPPARVEQLERVMRVAVEDGRPPPHPDTLPWPTTRATTPLQLRVAPVRTGRTT